MTRTIITISNEDKQWLDHYSHRHRQSMAETIREAIRHLRQDFKKGHYQDALAKTAGIWKKKKMPAAAYVENLRDEWQRPK